jgi:hypothetical protein
MLKRIREYDAVDVTTFHDVIVPHGHPAVLRGCVRDWPAIKKAAQSTSTFVTTLRSLDTGAEVALLVAPPAVRGRFFYNDDLTALNFRRELLPFMSALQRIVDAEALSDPPALAIQTAPIARHIPGFAAANHPNILSTSVKPHIWIGNAITVATHHDQANNLACVVAGRRRFTLFPPEALPNLYVGPFEFTPAGTPVSMVALNAPDLVKYPRFERALAAAEQAELGPGDAIYIPYLWWHHVESLESFNVLVNYWWNSARPGMGRPFDVLLHAMMTLRELPPTQRAALRAMFDYYVFQTHGDPGAHLPPHIRGVLAQQLNDEQRAQIKQALIQALTQMS